MNLERAARELRNHRFPEYNIIWHTSQSTELTKKLTTLLTELSAFSEKTPLKGFLESAGLNRLLDELKMITSAWEGRTLSKRERLTGTIQAAEIRSLRDFSQETEVRTGVPYTVHLNYGLDTIAEAIEDYQHGARPARILYIIHPGYSLQQHVFTLAEVTSRLLRGYEKLVKEDFRDDQVIILLIRGVDPVVNDFMRKLAGHPNCLLVQTEEAYVDGAPPGRPVMNPVPSSTMLYACGEFVDACVIESSVWLYKKLKLTRPIQVLYRYSAFGNKDLNISDARAVYETFSKSNSREICGLGMDRFRLRADP